MAGSEYYAVLGLTRAQVDKDPSCVKSAYRKLALQVHPDKAGLEGRERFEKITRAYQVLGDEGLRSVVDSYTVLPAEPEVLLEQAQLMFPGFDIPTAVGLLKIFVPEPSQFNELSLSDLESKLREACITKSRLVMMEQALLCFRSGLVDERVSYVNKISQQLPESDLITAVSIFKKALNARRSAWRMCAKECVKYVSVGNERLARLSGHQRDIIEGELLQLITEAATFVRNQKNHRNSITAQIELLKMHADLSRYLIEVYGHKPAVFRALTADTVHQATIAYEEANGLVLKSELDPSGPVALGLSLNFSVFTYEVLHKPREACKIAKRALDAVALKLGPLAVSGEAKDVEKRILTLVQYLRNNLVLWTSQPA